MLSQQEIKETARVIISFAYSYTLNKYGYQNELPESESAPSLMDAISSLEYLSHQIQINKSIKPVIQIPILLRSLTALSRYKEGTHLREEIDRQRLEVRRYSRCCLDWIQFYGDKQVQTMLVNVEYGRLLSISYSTAGGIGEEHDQETWNVLGSISRFLRDIHQGRNYRQPSFQPLPLLARVSLEQIEEEGTIEEIEPQMSNKGYTGYIKNEANEAKAAILNCFINWN
ncbi:MAG: hypothetical protein EZS28_002821 [Streblomastix strix]|uniref:Uncharacterized protein n=1 Tax=Streblomastix strix TaxID=222440 RepID=A0A5J4X3V1_9EUKA|nr:MAG: hypothetical protein EZS28_002821 [Streblomastix strix]